MKLSPEWLQPLREQKERSDSRMREEFGYVVERTGDALPDWKDHPFFMAILWEWYAPLAGDLPRGWYGDIIEECGRFFERLPWPPRDDTDSLSVASCRSALGLAATGLSDAQVRFLRDQLYVLAETVVDGCKVSQE